MGIKLEYKYPIMIFMIGIMIACIGAISCAVLATIYYGTHNDILWIIGAIIWIIGMVISIASCIMKANIDRRANRDVCTPVDI